MKTSLSGITRFGQRVRGDRVERVEAAGAELGRDHAPGAGQLAPEALREDAVDRARALEGDVDARVGDDLLRERLVEVPLDAPVALDRCARSAEGGTRVEAEVLLPPLRVQDPARVRHVAFLQYGRPRAGLGWLACL